MRAGAVAVAMLAAHGLAAASDVTAPDPAVAVTQEIELRLANPTLPAWLAPDARGAAQWAELQRFYKERSFGPAWLDEGVPASSDGAPQWPTALAESDLQRSYAFLRRAQELLEGRLSPRGASAYWAAPTAAELDGPGVLSEAVARGPQVVLAELTPEHPQYAALHRALDEHRDIAQAGGWPELPELSAPRRGRKDPRLPLLRERLVLSGDLPAGAVGVRAPDVYDRPLEQALKRFQARHGLPARGRLDDATLAALNVPVEDRLAQIELNIERWRWLPRALGERYVLVNVPSFELHAVQDGHTAERMRVVTGKTGETPTPIFSAEMTTAIFSPWWNVPPRIAMEEILPAMQRSRGYLRRRGLQLASTDGGFRQPPGPTNPMGLVKFLLPNPFNVYLHDTPNDGAFARARRDFSHGCMRVERPLELARWALNDPAAWPDRRIRAAMNARSEQHVRLPQPIPVHVTYFTVWVEDDGATRFLPDVYLHDEAQLRLLRGEEPWQRAATATQAEPLATLP